MIAGKVPPSVQVATLRYKLNLEDTMTYNGNVRGMFPEIVKLSLSNYLLKRNHVFWAITLTFRGRFL